MTAAARYRAACHALGLPVWRPGMAPVWRYPPADGWHWRLRIAADRDIAESIDGLDPDFTDPATVGCLLAAVREVWAAPTLFVRPTASGWTVMRGSGAGMGKLSDGPTEADALIAALEAAAARRGGQP